MWLQAVRPADRSAARESALLFATLRTCCMACGASAPCRAAPKAHDASDLRRSAVGSRAGGSLQPVSDRDGYVYSLDAATVVEELSPAVADYRALVWSRVSVETGKHPPDLLLHLAHDEV